jgi:hypothetical protein
MSNSDPASQFPAAVAQINTHLPVEPEVVVMSTVVYTPHNSQFININLISRLCKKRHENMTQSQLLVAPTRQTYNPIPFSRKGWRVLISIEINIQSELTALFPVHSRVHHNLCKARCNNVDLVCLRLIEELSYSRLAVLTLEAHPRNGSNSNCACNVLLCYLSVTVTITLKFSFRRNLVQ